MPKGKHRKPPQFTTSSAVAAAGVIGTTAGMVLSSGTANAAAGLVPNRVSDAAIAVAANSSGLAGCAGLPTGTWVAVALAESNGDANAHNANGEDSRGLWQINMRAHASWIGGRNLYDPATNAWAAHKVCQSSGARAWTAYTSGAYRQYLARGNAAAAAAAGGGGTVPVSTVPSQGTSTSWAGTNLSTRVGGRAPVAVRQVQQRLADLGYPISVDGVFGPQTNHFVIDYQRKRGLLADGVVGPRTWASLFGTV